MMGGFQTSTSYKIVKRFYETPATLKAGRDLINERFTRRLFGWLKFLSTQPRKSGFPPHNIGGQVRFTPTSSGEFKFKWVALKNKIFYKCILGQANYLNLS
jgi:hypothetical protein